MFLLTCPTLKTLFLRYSKIFYLFFDTNKRKRFIFGRLNDFVKIKTDKTLIYLFSTCYYQISTAFFQV